MTPLVHVVESDSIQLEALNATVRAAGMQSRDTTLP